MFEHMECDEGRLGKGRAHREAQAAVPVVGIDKLCTTSDRNEGDHNVSMKSQQKSMK